MRVSSSIAILSILVLSPGRAHAEDVEATPGTLQPVREVEARPSDGSYQLPAQDASRAPAWIATGVTGALLISAAATALKLRAVVVRRDELKSLYNTPAVGAELLELREDTRMWRNITFGLGLATLVSGGFTGYMWTRQERPRRRLMMTPQPTQGGAAVSLSGAF